MRFENFINFYQSDEGTAEQLMFTFLEERKDFLILLVEWSEPYRFLNCSKLYL